MKKEDLRITKSKTALRQAVANLLTKKGFSLLTVKEICQEADVNRMTFYKHYADKYQLLEDCLQQVRNEMYNKCLQSIEPNSADDNPALFCTSYMMSVQKVFTACKKMPLEYVQYSDSQLLSALHNSLKEGIRQMLLEISKYHSLVYGIDMTTTVLSGAATGVLYDNLFSHTEHDSTEIFNRMLSFFKRFFDSGLFVILNKKASNQ